MSAGINTPSEYIAEVVRLANNLSDIGLGMALVSMQRIHAECPKKIYRNGKIYTFPVKNKS